MEITSITHPAQVQSRLSSHVTSSYVVVFEGHSTHSRTWQTSVTMWHVHIFHVLKKHFRSTFFYVFSSSLWRKNASDQRVCAPATWRSMICIWLPGQKCAFPMLGSRKTWIFNDLNMEFWNGWQMLDPTKIDKNSASDFEKQFQISTPAVVVRYMATA